MKKIGIKTLASLVLAFMVVSMVLAQKPHHHSKEVRQKVHSYIKENVFPVLIKQREKLVLSAEEENTLDKLRGQLQNEIRPQEKELHKKIQQAHQNQQCPSDELKEQMHALQQKKHEIIRSAMHVAEPHKQEIRNLMTEIDSDIEKWKTDLRLIMGESESDKNHEGKRRKCGYRDGEGSEEHRYRGGILGKFLNPGGFLLLNAENLATAFEEEEWEANEERFSSAVFPNPSGIENNVSVELKENSNLKIELIDAKGNILKTLVNEAKTAGSYSFDADLSDLKNGLYFYRISTNKGTETKRLILNK